MSEANRLKKFLEAARDGRLEELRRALLAGMHVDGLDQDSCRSALHRASSRGHSAEVQLLIEFMATLDCQKFGGWTPLHLACRYGHTDVVRLLAAAQADSNLQDKDGMTPVYVAAECGNADAVQCLVGTADCCLCRQDNAWTPAHVAARFGHEKVLIHLTSLASADPNLPDLWGRTPLHLAAQHGHSRAAATLVAAGAELNPRDQTGATPLHWAASMGHEGTVKWLLTEGCDPHAVDVGGANAVEVAGWFGQCKVVSLMRGQIFHCVLDECKSLKALSRCLAYPESWGELSSESTISMQLNASMIKAGFVAERAALQATISKILQSILRYRSAEYITNIVGSFSEGWGNCLTSLNGQTDLDSDIDVTELVRHRLFHIRGRCRCKNVPQLEEMVDYSNGHVVCTGVASNPAQAWMGSILRPASDRVWAYPCCRYPRIALLQTHYRRTHIRRSVLRSLRRELAGSTCHLVAAAPPGQAGQRLRVSTNFLERRLMRSLTSEQGQVFVLLKYIVKRIISPLPQGLKTYHVKTLVFSLLDEKASENWQPCQLASLVREGLRKLLDYLRDTSHPDRCMRHFFLQDAWLYLKSGHANKDALARLVSEAMDRLPSLLGQFKLTLRSLRGNDFHFHPFLIIPNLTQRPVSSQFGNLAYHEIYDVVKSVLLKLTDMGILSDAPECLKKIKRLPSCAVTARQCLMALYSLKLSSASAAVEALTRLSMEDHDDTAEGVPASLLSRAEVWQHLQQSDSAWKFCFRFNKRPSFDAFLPDCISCHFPIVIGYDEWYYINFRALAMCLRFHLRLASEATARDWFQGLHERDNADVQDLLTTLQFCQDKNLLVRIIHKHRNVICNYPETVSMVTTLMRNDKILVRESMAETERRLHKVIKSQECE